MPIHMESLVHEAREPNVLILDSLRNCKQKPSRCEASEPRLCLGSGQSALMENKSHLSDLYTTWICETS